MTGRLLDERLGRWNFWVMFVGFNVGFFPMHISGLMGMPRRVYTYPEGMGWDTLNLITTIGSFVFALGILLLLINVAVSLRRGRLAGPNPWDAADARMGGAVAAAALQFRGHPDRRQPASAVGRPPRGKHTTAPSLDRGLALDRGKESLATTGLDAQPDLILKMPEEFHHAAAAGAGADGGLRRDAGACLVAGRGRRRRRTAVPAGLAVAARAVSDRPRSRPVSDIAADMVLQPRALPVGSVSQRSAGWWAMVCGIITEAALFAYLLFSYYLFRHPAACRRLAAGADGLRALASKHRHPSSQQRCGVVERARHRGGQRAGNS